LAKDAGDVDVLVNNAGLALSAPRRSSTSRVDALFAATFALRFMSWPRSLGMAARGKGSIVNIASMAASSVLREPRRYGADEGGARVDDAGLAAEFSPSGVRVNAVAPGRCMPEDPSGS